MVTLYGLKNCDTCKKAHKALESAGKPATFKDVRADGVSQAQLEKWLEAVGREKLLNTRSTTWRNLDDNAKNIGSDADVLTLLNEHPTLIKRPVIETDDGAVSVGWTKDVQAAFC